MKDNVSNSKRQFHNARIWGYGSFMHVCFESVGCRFRKHGYCLICDYGAGKNVKAQTAIKILNEAVEKWPYKVDRLLLGTCGSILDPVEMSRDTLCSILNSVSRMKAEHVLLETHYTTICEEVLDLVHQALPHKKIYIEMGLESANPEVLEKSIRKYMDLSLLQKSMRVIADHGMNTILNVFLGAPFLTEQEQIDDAYAAIRWALHNGASEVVIFPANLKPGTELWDMYQAGRYHRISHRLVLALLARLNEQELECISVSWYGDRQYAGIDTDILAPSVPDGCQIELMDFYRAFMQNFNGLYRKQLIRQIQETIATLCPE